MPEFDPIKIFKRMWGMRWWGRMLVAVTIVLTAFAFLSSFLWFGDTNYKVAIFIFYALAVIMWAILILFYLEIISRLKKNLDKLISKGEWISARLTVNTEAMFDKYDLKIQDWDTSVNKVLKGTEYEISWMSNVDLPAPEDTSQLVDMENLFAVLRNYMAQRLSRLKEIKDSL